MMFCKELFREGGELIKINERRWHALPVGSYA